MVVRRDRSGAFYISHIPIISLSPFLHFEILGASRVGKIKDVEGKGILGIVDIGDGGIKTAGLNESRSNASITAEDIDGTRRARRRREDCTMNSKRWMMGFMAVFVGLAPVSAPSYAEYVMHARVSYDAGGTMVLGAEGGEWGQAPVNTLILPGDTLWVDSENVSEI